MIDTGELMPADKYGYHPTDAQMTFGKLVAHITTTNTVICSIGTPDVCQVVPVADDGTAR